MQVLLPGVSSGARQAVRPLHRMPERLEIQIHAVCMLYKKQQACSAKPDTLFEPARTKSFS